MATTKKPEKRSAELTGLVRDINSSVFAKGSDLVHFGDAIVPAAPPATSGSWSLDHAMSGGWSANKWHEIVGEASAGKTALAYLTIAANQRRDPAWSAVWIAGEDFVDEYALLYGVDLKRVIIVDTNVAEEAFEAILWACSSHSVDCVVLDSLPSLVPKAEDEGGMDDTSVGLMARRTNQFFRKARSAIKRSMIDPDARPVFGLIINQWRSKIGVQYGDPRTTPGGQGKEYFFSTRVEVRRSDWIEGRRKHNRIGQVVACRILKNKSGAPERRANFDLYFAGPKAGSVDQTQEVVNLLLELELVERSGAYYTLPVTGERVKGRNGLYEAVGESEALMEQLRSAISGALDGG